MTHASTVCNGCSQTDDHPMIHVFGQYGQVQDPSFHFDCLPPVYEALLGNEPQHAVTLSAIAAARSGVHGDDLRAHIAEQDDDNQAGADTAGDRSDAQEG